MTTFWVVVRAFEDESPYLVGVYPDFEGATASAEMALPEQPKDGIVWRHADDGEWHALIDGLVVIVVERATLP